MRILAIDTALEACAVAVFDAAREEVVAHESVAMARGHAEALMPMIARVLQSAAPDFSSIDRIAVTVGPGSFTGLRVGIAAARGLALATTTAVVGLSTLEAFAAPFIAADGAHPVMAVVDARHDHVYMQVFGEGGRILVGARVVPMTEALHLTAGLAPRIVGNAAAKVAVAWPANEPAPVEVVQNAAPVIEWVARLGAVADVASSPPKPLYLRAPDAQPQPAAQVARQ